MLLFIGTRILSTINGFILPNRLSLNNIFNCDKIDKHISTIIKSCRESSGNNYLSDENGDKESNDEKRGNNGELFSYIFSEVNRMKLEEANTRRFLKSRPKFFSYGQARNWVDAQNRGGMVWRSKEDWDDWISMGEGKPSLVPSRPEEHYSRLDTWVSWSHFLSLQSGEQD